MPPFDVGRIVEVTPNIPEMKDVYFLAQILHQVNQKVFYVRYEHVFDQNGDKLIHLIPRFLIHPLPPLVIASPSIDEEVDVPLINGWWKSTVTHTDGAMVTEKLAHSDVVGAFDISSIRMHQEWNRRNPSYWKYKKIED